MSKNGLPALSEDIRILKHTSSSFGGYDAREAAGISGAAAMTNMSSDGYPYMRPRPRRYRTVTAASLTAFGAYDKPFWVDGTSFYYDGTVKGTVAAGAKVFSALNAYIIIMPDKKYYKPATDVFGSLEAAWTGTVAFADGTLYGEAATANAITTAGAVFPFTAGDAVTVSGCTTHADNNQTSIIREISADKKSLYFYENIFTVGTESGTVTLARTVPDMDYICECSNRLWGCKGDTIYASALGDPNNFNTFDGVATDSYAVDVGSAGDFTGCFSYLGYPVFFKEDFIYKVYGSKPSNYEAMSSATLGAASGSHLSFAVAGETLYYLSRAGIVAYTGGIPENISAPFAGVRYKNAVAGSDGVKYYVSMQDGDGAWHLFVFDPRYAVWHREDATHAVGFGWQANLLMAISTGIWAAGTPEAPSGASAEPAVAWNYETGDITEGDVYKSDIKKLLLRAELDPGASMKVEVRYGTGPWQPAASIAFGDRQPYYIPVIPRRSDRFRLRFSGTGTALLISLTRETAHGGSAM